MPHSYICAIRELLAQRSTAELKWWGGSKEIFGFLIFQSRILGFRKIWQVFCLDLSRDFFGVFKTIICNLKIGVVLDIYASRIFLERTRLGKGNSVSFYTFLVIQQVSFVSDMNKVAKTKKLPVHNFCSPCLWCHKQLLC